MSIRKMKCDLRLLGELECMLPKLLTYIPDFAVRRLCSRNLAASSPCPIDDKASGWMKDTNTYARMWRGERPRCLLILPLALW